MLLCIATFLIVPLITVAEDESIIDKPKHESVAGVELDIKRWDLSHYVAMVNTEDTGFIDSKIVGGMNTLTNFFFILTKWIADVIDTGIGYMYSLDAITLLSDKVAGISKLLWSNLEKEFGILFFLLAVLHIFFIYVGKRNSQEALKKSFQLFLVIGVTVIWFSNASWYMKVINNVTDEVQGIVMKTGTAFVNDSDVNIQKGKELDGSLAIMRNAYFQLIVEKPYLIMNYGTPDKGKVLADDKERINNMLRYKMTDKGMKKKEEEIAKEIEENDNSNMAASNVANQMGIALLSLGASIILGIPLLAIAFLNFILQVLALAIMVILPTTFMMSYLPSFVHGGWKTLGSLLAVFLMKAFVGMLILFVFLIVTIMDALIPAVNTGMYFLNVLAIAVSILLIINFRNKFIEFFTAGQVMSMDNHIPKQSADAIKNGWKKMKEKSEEKKKGETVVSVENVSIMVGDSQTRVERLNQDQQESDVMNNNQEERVEREEQVKELPEATEIQSRTDDEQPEMEERVNRELKQKDLHLDEEDNNLIYLKDHIEARRQRSSQDDEANEEFNFNSLASQEPPESEEFGEKSELEKNRMLPDESRDTRLDKAAGDENLTQPRIEEEDLDGTWQLRNERIPQDEYFNHELNETVEYDNEPGQEMLGNEEVVADMDAWNERADDSATVSFADKMDADMLQMYEQSENLNRKEAVYGENKTEPMQDNEKSEWSNVENNQVEAIRNIPREETVQHPKQEQHSREKTSQNEQTNDELVSNMINDVEESRIGREGVDTIMMLEEEREEREMLEENFDD